ncbi:MAG: DUF3307 domain-containing protein [Saprospiraceae bacterium]|nr:DUF3307 domain-containing protein [Saprospiraceae bacterium]
MDIWQFLILQFIAHLLTDFFLQPNRKAREKNDIGFKSKFLKWHILIAFILSWLLSLQINFIIGALAIAICHWIVDGLKKHINNNTKIGRYAFFIDQVLHLLFIVLFVFLFDKYLEIETLLNIAVNIKYLLLIALYVLCLKPANIFIKEVFNAFQISISENNDLPNAGKLIGIIERLLVLTFVVLNQYEAVGFLIAAKSILRYKSEDSLKTEYVLIGTMLSFGIAICLGVIYHLI